MDEEEVPTFSSVVSATNRNLTRLTRNVAITASTVMSGDQPSLAAPSAYHRAMSEVATYQKRLVASKIRENTPRQAIRQSLVRLGGFRAPQIPDELLIDLPPPRTQHSLFQAFEDTAPHATQSTESVPNPRALAVRKEMASSELVEIDERIAELRNLRKLVFERMAEVERMQTSDEPTLQHFYPAGERIKSFTPEPRPNYGGGTGTGTGGGEPISFVDFNSPFGQLALARGDCVELYELSVDSHTKLRGTQGQEVRCLAVHGSDPIVGSGAGNNVYLWNGSNPEPSELVGHVGPVVGVSLDGSSVVSASEDKTVRHWDDRIGKCIGTIDSFAYGTCLSLQHMGNALATGFEDGVVRLWDLREATGSGMAAGRPQRELVGGHTGPVSTLHFTGLELVSGSIDGSVRIWDLRTGQISHAEAYPGPVTALSFDATKVVTAIKGEHGVRVLSRATNEHRISAIEDSTVAAAQYMKGYLVTGRESGEVGVYAV